MDVFDDEYIQAEIDRHLAAELERNVVHIPHVTSENVTEDALANATVGETNLHEDGDHWALYISVVAVLALVAVLVAVSWIQKSLQRRSLRTLLKSEAVTQDLARQVAAQLRGAPRLSSKLAQQVLAWVQAAATSAAAQYGGDSLVALEARVRALHSGGQGCADGAADVPTFDLPQQREQAQQMAKALDDCLELLSDYSSQSVASWTAAHAAVRGDAGVLRVVSRLGKVLAMLQVTAERLLKEKQEAGGEQADVYARSEHIRGVLTVMRAVHFPGAAGLSSADGTTPRLAVGHNRSRSSWIGRPSLSARMSVARGPSRMSMAFMDTPRGPPDAVQTQAVPKGLPMLLSTELSMLDSVRQAGEQLYDARTIAQEIHDKAMGREPGMRTEAIAGRQTRGPALRNGPVLLAEGEESDVRRMGVAGGGSSAVQRMTSLMQYRQPGLSPIVEIEHATIEQVLEQSQMAAEKAAPALLSALQRALDDLSEAVQLYREVVQAAGRHYTAVLTGIAATQHRRFLSGEKELRSAMELLPKLDRMMEEPGTLTSLLLQRAKEHALSSLQQAATRQAAQTSSPTARVAIPLGLQDVGLLLAQANRAREAEESGEAWDEGEGEGDSEGEGRDTMYGPGSDDEEGSERGAAQASPARPRSTVATVDSRNAGALSRTDYGDGGSPPSPGGGDSHQHQLLAMYLSGYAVVQAQAVTAMHEQRIRDQLMMVQQERHHLSLMLEARNNAQVVAGAVREGLTSLTHAMQAHQEKQVEAIKDAMSTTTRALHQQEASRLAKESVERDAAVVLQWKRKCLFGLRFLLLTGLYIALAVMLTDQLARIGPALYKSFSWARWVYGVVVPTCTFEDTAPVVAAAAPVATGWLNWASSTAASVTKTATSWFSSATICMLQYAGLIAFMSVGGVSVLMAVIMLLQSLQGSLLLATLGVGWAWYLRHVLADLLPAAVLVGVLMAVQFTLVRFFFLERCLFPKAPAVSEYEEHHLSYVTARAARTSAGTSAATQAAPALHWPSRMARSLHGNALARQTMFGIALLAMVLYGVACGVWVSRSVPRPLSEVLYPPLLYAACNTEGESGNKIAYFGVTNLKLEGLLLAARLTGCAVSTGTETMVAVLGWGWQILAHAATKPS